MKNDLLYEPNKNGEGNEKCLNSFGKKIKLFQDKHMEYGQSLKGT